MKVLAMLVILAINIAHADGIDDPNFYKDFNPNDPNPPAKYDRFAPPGWKAKQFYHGNVVPIPSTNIPCLYNWGGECSRVRNIPEPTELLLLATGVAGLCAWRRYK